MIGTAQTTAPRPGRFRDWLEASLGLRLIE